MDHAYGSAIPQLYLEAGYGDLSCKVGHFYTIIGYEVVTAPDNFFYSHAYTMYNSEPFTHTGALVLPTRLVTDMTIYGGYVFGWDSGFEDNGDAFLGGVSLESDRSAERYVCHHWRSVRRDQRHRLGGRSSEATCTPSSLATR